MQCPCKCQMLVCIVCWQHDRKSKMQLSISLHSQVSSAGLTYIQAWIVQYWQWCWLLLHTQSNCTCQPPCRHQQHNILPHSELEVLSTTQNTEIRQSKHADRDAEEFDLQRAETLLYSPNPSLMEYINKSCHTRWKKMYYAYTNCTFNAADLQITVLGGEVVSGRLTTGHLIHCRLPTVHSTSDNSFVI